MKVVIMAGGKGTRISSIASNIPKPMIQIQGKPVLEYTIQSLKEQGFNDFIITISYYAEYIVNYFGDGSKYGINIEYFYELEALGNAGALFKLKDKLTDDFLLLNADLIFDVYFERFIAFHKNHKSVVTLFTHPNNHPYDIGVLVVDEEKAVVHWLTKEESRPDYYKNRVNAGLHILSPEIFDIIDIDSELVGTIDYDGKIVKVDLDRQLLKPLAGTKKIFCYDSPEYVKDMGTPERYKMVCEELLTGKIRKNLKYLQKAIFLDRDGTINKYVGFLNNIDEFEILPGVSEAIQIINNSGYLAIVVTNQPVIARGELTYEELDKIHNKMETLLGSEGAYLDAIYFCPHHPHKGFKGEVVNLKINCECRKPKPGMLLEAARDFNISLTQSWIIGDGENDINAGKTVGCKTALIGNKTFGQEITALSLLDAVNQILKC